MVERSAEQGGEQRPRLSTPRASHGPFSRGAMSGKTPLLARRPDG
jgi:hypothetical protein